jgi:hypothetical protein
MAKAFNRTAPKQIEHWDKIGEMMEDNGICQTSCHEHFITHSQL